MAYFGWRRVLQGTPSIGPRVQGYFLVSGGRGIAGNGKGIHPPEVKEGSLFPEGVKQGDPKRLCQRWGMQPKKIKAIKRSKSRGLLACPKKQNGQASRGVVIFALKHSYPQAAP